MNDIWLRFGLLNHPIDTRQTPDVNSKNQDGKLDGRAINELNKICRCENLFVPLQRKPRDTEKNTKKEKGI